MSDGMSSVVVLTRPAEIAFPPSLFEKRKTVRKDGATKFVTVPASDPDGRWEATLVLSADHPDLVHIKALCKQIAESKSPGITASPTAWKYPWQSADSFIAKQEMKPGAKKRDNDWLRGRWLLNAHTNLFAPRLALLMPGRGFVDFADDAARLTVKDKFYAGCEVLAELNFQWYAANVGPPGVTCYLNSLCSLNKGERRAGSRPAAETFSAYLGHVTAVDPTAGVAAEDY
jgi:hypothetical protein